MDYVAGKVSCGNSEADNVLISLVYEDGWSGYLPKKKYEDGWSGDKDRIKNKKKNKKILVDYVYILQRSFMLHNLNCTTR